MKRSTLARASLALVVGSMAGLVWPQGTGKVTPAQLLADYSTKAGAPASPERGRKLFNTNFGKEFGWSCATCHGAVPTRNGKHDVSEKVIKPLAPAANPARFTDSGQVEFYFKLNCRDVVGRECTAQEKADVLSWLLTLKP